MNGADPQQPTRSPEGPAPDPDLVGLVQLADAFGLEYPLVLTLAGQVLSGTLVSGRVFATEVADLVQGEDPDETLRGTLAARFRARAEDLGDWGAASQLGALDPASTGDLPALPEVHHVHLRDVSVLTSAATGRHLPLWRGRLADVVGWTIGGFVADPD